MVFVIIKFIMDMNRYEKLLKADLAENDQGGMFRTIRLKKLDGEDEAELKCLFENIVGFDQVENVCNIYHINNYMKKHQKIENLRV